VTPSPTDAFWGHVPGWAWPLIVVGILAFFLVQAIKGYESVAKLFGSAGRILHERATQKAMKRVERGAGVDVKLLQEEMSNVLGYVQRMESSLARTTDDQECAMAYLVSDASWHHNVDIILAEHFPHGSLELPHRVPFSMFSQRWREGWRPSTYFQEEAECK
jgi:hypothetical protein